VLAARVLVLGATGQLGADVVDAFRSAGWDVVGLGHRMRHRPRELSGEARFMRAKLSQRLPGREALPGWLRCSRWRCHRAALPS